MRGGDETRVGGFLPAILVSTSALKLSLAWLLPGFLTGDDVEVVETAARCASGLDYTPSAIRSLVHPLLLACPVVRLGLLAGLGGPRWITLLASLPTVAFSTAAIALLHRLARALGLTPSGARVATLLYALHWLPLGYGSTAFPRPISSCLLLASFLLLAETGERPGAGALAAGMLAAAATAVAGARRSRCFPCSPSRPFGRAASEGPFLCSPASLSPPSGYGVSSISGRGAGLSRAFTPSWT